MKFKLLIVLIVVLFSVQFSSANGLQIDPSSISVNKTFNVDEEIQITIENQEPFIFFNISFEQQSFIEIETITELLSGQNMTVIATITSNQNLENEEIRLKGFFETDVGDSDEEYNIDVSFEDGIDNELCFLTIIEGDSVIWHNLVNNEIVMRNMDTGNDITTILESGNYTINFDSPLNLNYAFFRFGFQFTDICSVNVLDSSGFVNDPNLDAIFVLTVIIDFPFTVLEATFPEGSDSYEMEFFGTQEGLFTLKNIGDNVAKDISITAEWFTFEPNIFDLGTGEQRVVSYTIEPSGFENSNQTNQTYFKNVSIVGNFDTIIKEFNIFIEFSPFIGDFGGDGQSIQDIIKALIDAYCDDNPSDCGLGGGGFFNGSTSFDPVVALTDEQRNELFSLLFNAIDSGERTQNIIIDFFARVVGLETAQNNTDTKLDKVLDKLIGLEKEQKDRNTLNITVILIALLSLSVVSTLVIVFMVRKNIDKDKFKRWLN